MKRREFLTFLGCAGAAAACSPARWFGGEEQQGSSPIRNRPNIVFIMSDDHTLEAISCYDSWLKDHAKTPNIDRIAREGMRFTNVCCNNSICSPSRASIITGQYSHKNGIKRLGGHINEESPWLSVELQKAGYQTGLFGKWHLHSAPKGFDDYFVVKGQGRYFNPTLMGPRGTKTIEGYATDVFTDIALDWLQKLDRKRPFCLLLHHKAPHEPFDYPDRFADLYKNENIPEPGSLYEDNASSSPLLKAKHYSMIHGGTKKSYYGRYKLHKQGTHETEREKRAFAYQHLMKKYLRCITAVDENVGRVLDYLDSKDLENDTVVIYTSDQGYWLGQHGFFDKRLILETSLKMPFLIRYPKEIRPSRVNDDLCVNVDFAPTFLDYAGASAPSAMQGRSLRPLTCSQTPPDWRKAVFYAYWAREPLHWGVRTERYKLIHFPGTKEIEFYDLETDPGELTNQAANSKYKDAVRDCEEALKRLMVEIDISTDELPAVRGPSSRNSGRENKR